jgi:hypothetical protein
VLATPGGGFWFRRTNRDSPMYQCASLSVVLLCLIAAEAFGQPSAIVTDPNLAAGRPNGSIQLDGKLDEAAWRQVSTIAELIQQSPKPGESTPYKTTVRVLITPDDLYFGFDCSDTEPSRIAIHTMQRDGDVEGDDTVAVILDTYGDRRTGYFFQINAAGARVDGLVSRPRRPEPRLGRHLGCANLAVGSRLVGRDYYSCALTQFYRRPVFLGRQLRTKHRTRPNRSALEFGYSRLLLLRPQQGRNVERCSGPEAGAGP